MTGYTQQTTMMGSDRQGICHRSCRYFKPGDYEIKYSVADSSKNESEVKRTVHVTDSTAPQIKLSGDDFMSVKKGDKYSDPGYTATDNCDGDITDSAR